jgi:hypothetical protein
MFNEDQRCEWEGENPGKIDDRFERRDPMKNYNDDLPDECYNDDGRIIEKC